MNILLTGSPGIGKTTAIVKIIESLGIEDLGGFISQEIRVGGARTGFSIRTLDGFEGILASIKLQKGPRVGKYLVSVENIETIAIPSLQRARENKRFIIIDEIASMELKSSLFALEVRKCLDAGKVIGTIQYRTHPFLDEIRARRDVELLRLTSTNRNEIPGEVVDRFT